MFYCRHVVSELREFYKEEYDLLEMLSSGQTKSFIEKSLPLDATKHLENYGLLSMDKNKMPMISIPVVARYIGYEYMRREGRKTIYKLVEPANRENWLNDMKRSIIYDLRFLEATIEKKKMPQLFGPNSFPEADEFYKTSVVSDKASYGGSVENLDSPK